LRFLLLPQLMRLRDEGFEVTAISAPGPWRGEIEANGIRHVAWPHATRSWHPSADAAAFWELFRTFRRERFDIVHTHNPKPGILGRIAARWAGVPCVVHTTHGLYATKEDRLGRKAPVLAAEWLAARFSDLELYQSEEDLAWARRIGLVDPRRSVLLGNGVDPSRFDPSLLPAHRTRRLRSELGIPEGAVVVGTVARLVREKGYRELFTAAALLRRRFPDVRFLAVGPDDPEKADRIGEDEIREASRDVIFAGHRVDIPDLLAVMDVFVLPSWREGVPRSAIEAAAAGRALVLTDIRGCREVARDGIEGLLVPPRDPARLAAAIARLVVDPELRQRLGRAARARALERFDERRVIEVVLEEYRRLLARRPPSGRTGRHLAVVP